MSSDFNHYKNKQVKNKLIAIREILEYTLKDIVSLQGMTLKELANQNLYKEVKNTKIQKIMEISNKYKLNAIKQEPYITNDIKSLESKVAFLVNSNTVLKSKNSLARKILLYSNKFNINLEDAANKMCDIIRYTLVLDDRLYIEEVQRILDKIIDYGYKVIPNKFENHWGDLLYQGINVGLLTPYNTKIEIQFHTYESYATKEYLNHIYYEIYRNPFINGIEKKLAEEIMRINQSLVKIPKKAIGYEYKHSPKKYKVKVLKKCNI